MTSDSGNDATVTTGIASDTIKNDNSNPQQGTGRANTAMAATTSTEQAAAAQTNDSSGSSNNNNRTNSDTTSMRSPPKRKDCRKLFVGGLPADVTQEEFRLFFEQFGPITDSVVMFDRETRRSRGFGFVTYQSAEVAAKVLSMREGEEENNEAGQTEESENAPTVGRLIMRGKACEVKAAEPKPSSRYNRRGYNQNQGSGSTAAAMSYPQGKGHPVTSPQATAPAHAAQYHPNPHYMAGHQYPMATPSYYPAYHPGMAYPEAAAVGYPAVPMYAPMAHPAYPVQMSHPQMSHHQGLYLQHYNMPWEAYQGTTNHPVPGTPSSAMQPAAPGLPNKEE